MDPTSHSTDSSRRDSSGAARPLNPQELGLLLRTLRWARDWSQQEVADRASIPVRQVQRLEAGESNDRDLRRALAAAFDLRLDALDQPAAMPAKEDIITAYETVAHDHVVLAVQRVQNGRQLAALSLVHTLDVFLEGCELQDAAARALVALLDLMHEYRDLADLYAPHEQPGVHDQLDLHLDALRAQGVSLCFGERALELHLKPSIAEPAWPWRTSILYLVAFLSQRTPSQIEIGRKECGG